MLKKLIALLLCLCLCVSLLPAAFAGDIEIADEEKEALIPVIDPVDEPDRTAPDPDAEIMSDSGSCGDDLSWYLNSNGVLEINGIGAMYDYDTGSNKAPWYDRRTEIKTLELGHWVESIGDYAFYGCINMTLDPLCGYSLRKTITRIGQGAFLCCHGLEYVCLPPSVTDIGGMAFETCHNLKRVTICGSPSIGALAFANCPKLEEISFLGDAPSFSGSVFSNDPYCRGYYPPDNSTWTSSVLQSYGGDMSWWAEYHGWCGDGVDWRLDTDGRLTLYGSGATWRFRDANGILIDAGFKYPNLQILSIYVSVGVTELGGGLFCGMYDLTEAELPDTLTVIGDECFIYSGLPSLTIPASVTEIGYKAFYSCDELTEVRFLGHPPQIDDDAFSGITVKATYYPVYSWHVSAGAQQNYGGTITWSCDDKLGSYVYWELDESGELLLYGAGETWDFDSSVYGKSPGFRYFIDECLSVRMWSGVETIGENMFRSMSHLQQVQFPQSLTSIGYYAFSDCKALRQISFDGEAPEIHSAAFSGGKKITAFYHDDPSWTSDVMKNYGASKITWVDFDTPLSISESPIKIPMYQAKQLTVSTNDGRSINAVWSSSDESVATVDEDGWVWSHKYGKCTITATAGEKTLDCEVQILFSDVTDTDKYYYTPVYWAADNNITVGYTSGEYAGMFGVGQDCERRQVMIFLWRFAGSPTKDKNGKAYGDARTMFNDLSDYGPSSGTNKAIAWGYKEGIVKGYTDGGFHPTASIVRKDVMIMLYRLAGKPSVSGKLTWPDCQEYSTSSDTYKAILWGSKNGITKGYSSGEYAGNFGTKVNCLREQIVTFLYRARNLL